MGFEFGGHLASRYTRKYTTISSAGYNLFESVIGYITPLLPSFPFPEARAHGIKLDLGSSNNTISRNNIANNEWNGIGFYYGSSDNIISRNNITNSDDGISLSSSSNNARATLATVSSSST